MVIIVGAKVGYHTGPHLSGLVHGPLQFVEDAFSSLTGLQNATDSTLDAA